MTQHRPLPAGRGILYISIAAAAWGTGGAVAAILYGSSGLGPIAVTFWRFAGCVLLLLAVRLITGRSRRAGSSRWRILAIGVGLATSQATYFAAVEYAGVAVATLVTIGAGPVLIAVGARVLLGERLGRLGLAATGVALAGLVLLAGGGIANPAPAPALGIGYALVSALGYAGVTLLSRRTGGPATTLDGFAIGMLCLLPLALLEGVLPASGNLLQTGLLLGYLGAVPTALAYGLFFAGLAVVRAATASVIVLLEPLVAAAIAAGLLGERLTVTATVGGLLMLGSIGLLAVWDRYRADASVASACSTVNARR